MSRRTDTTWHEQSFLTAMNIDELAEHLKVSRRTVYNYRSQVDKLIARSSFEKKGREQLLIAQYLPFYEKLATGDELPSQYSEQTTTLDYETSVQYTPIDAELVDGNAAGYIVRAEIIDTPSVPGLPAIVHLHTDLSQVEQYCQGMSQQSSALETVILSHAVSDAEALKGKLKGIYKTKMAEAKNEALRETLG